MALSKLIEILIKSMFETTSIIESTKLKMNQKCPSVLSGHAYKRVVCSDVTGKKSAVPSTDALSADMLHAVLGNMP